MERIEVIFNSINQHINPNKLNNDTTLTSEILSQQSTAEKSENLALHQNKWNEVLSLVNSTINHELFKAWIAPLVLLDIVEDMGSVEDVSSVEDISSQNLSSLKITLEVSNKFAKEHILREYGSHIIEAIKKVFECSNVELAFTIATAPVVKSKLLARTSSEHSKAVLAKKISNDSNLNSNYNFSNYVVGSCNKLAHAACTKVSEELGTAFNPLFIYGGVGLGKTHLVNAIGNAAIRRNKKVLLASSEKFVSELVGSLKTNSMDKFKVKFRNIDLLIIDDIQFIIGKQRTQEEFFHTFNELFNNQKQIVITSDRIPQELTQLEDRLRTRFSSGLYVDLQKPDFETRVKIFRKKAELLALDVPEECVKIICEKVNSNIRELEGVINRLKAYSSLSNSRIDLPVVINILDKIAPASFIDVNSDVIQDAVSSRYGVSVADLVGKRRTQNVALARQLAMYLCREITSMSYPEIGALFGGRDHSTVIHAYKVISEKCSKDGAFKAQLDEITNLIQGK